MPWKLRCSCRSSDTWLHRTRPQPRWPRITPVTPHSASRPTSYRATRTDMRTTPPFRADHVGSLLRPPALLDARAKFSAGEIDAGQLCEVEDAAIVDIVAMQEQVGLQSA